MTTNTASSAAPATSSAITLGLAQPVGWPFHGRIPYVTETMISTSPSANVRLPHQSIWPWRGVLSSRRLW